MKFLFICKVEAILLLLSIVYLKANRWFGGGELAERPSLKFWNIWIFLTKQNQSLALPN